MDEHAELASLHHSMRRLRSPAVSLTAAWLASAGRGSPGAAAENSAGTVAGEFCFVPPLRSRAANCSSRAREGCPFSVMILVTDCWAGAGSPRVAARAAIVAMFMVVQDGVRLGGKLNRLK
ncbi:MAG: hypothetical protein ACLRPT_08290 [Akkermansia muciniphila]